MTPFDISLLVLAVLLAWESAVIKRALDSGIVIETRRLERAARSLGARKDIGRTIALSTVVPAFIGSLWGSQQRISTDDLPLENFSFVFLDSLDGGAKAFLRSVIDSQRSSYVYLAYSGGGQVAEIEGLSDRATARKISLAVLEDVDRSIAEAFGIEQMPCAVIFGAGRKAERIVFGPSSPPFRDVRGASKAVSVRNARSRAR